MQYQIPQANVDDAFKTVADTSLKVDAAVKESTEQKELSVILKEVLKIRTPFDFVKRHNAEIYRHLEDDKFPETLKESLRATIVKPDDETIAMYTAEIMKEDFDKLHYSIATIGDEAYIYDGSVWRLLPF